MSKLMDKLKKEAADLKKKGEERKKNGDFQKVDWYTPDKGDNIIRILPHWKKPGEELFFLPVNLHYGFPKKTEKGTYNIPARCRRDFGETCPACEGYDKLIETDKDAAKKIRVVERYLYNVLNYKEKKVQVYACPTSVHTDIIYWANEVDTDVTEIENGRNFKLTKEVDPSKPAQFGTEYKVRPDLKETKVPTKLRTLWAEGLPKLDEVYSEDRTEEMVEKLKTLGVSVTVKSTKKTSAKEEEATEEADDEMPSFEEEEEETSTAPESEDEGVEEPSLEGDDDLEEELKRLGVE